MNTLLQHLGIEKLRPSLLFFLEWASTGFLLTGVALTSFNIYPMNIYLSLIGNVGWLFVSLAWRKWSIITVQFVIVMIYIVGMIREYFF
jgi:ABC-type siderophore export system fused ATPase/permease subunit